MGDHGDSAIGCAEIGGGGPGRSGRAVRGGLTGPYAGMVHVQLARRVGRGGGGRGAAAPARVGAPVPCPADPAASNPRGRGWCGPAGRPGPPGRCLGPGPARAPTPAINVTDILPLRRILLGFITRACPRGRSRGPAPDCLVPPKERRRVRWTSPRLGPDHAVIQPSQDLAAPRLKSARGDIGHQPVFGGVGPGDHLVLALEGLPNAATGPKISFYGHIPRALGTPLTGTRRG